VSLCHENFVGLKNQGSGNEDNHRQRQRGVGPPFSVLYSYFPHNETWVGAGPAFRRHHHTVAAPSFAVFEAEKTIPLPCAVLTVAILSRIPPRGTGVAVFPCVYSYPRLRLDFSSTALKRRLPCTVDVVFFRFCNHKARACSSLESILIHGCPRAPTFSLTPLARAPRPSGSKSVRGVAEFFPKCTTPPPP